jgi:hypothetical protein
LLAWLGADGVFVAFAGNARETLRLLAFYAKGNITIR